jgi:transposase
MFIKLNKSPTTKKHSIQLVEGYRKDGKVRHRVLKVYGNLEDLVLREPNILERLRKEAKDKTVSSKASLTLDLLKPLYQEQTALNIGYKFIDKVLNELSLSSFIRQYQEKERISYDLEKILKLLVFSRLLNPSSKLNTFEERRRFMYDFEDLKIGEIYKSLDDLAAIKDSLCIHLNKELLKQNKRDVSLVFYDVTNYYFESERTSLLRAKGVSKENQETPLVQMGLFIDNLGLPITYELFKGSTNDLSTMKVVLEKIRKDYHLGKITIVADKGNNSKENLDLINKEGDKYVISQRIRNRGHELTDIVLDEEGYLYSEDKTFKFKAVPRVRLFEGREIKEHVLCFWSKKEDEYQKRKRGHLEEIIQKFINNPSLLNASNTFGIKKYFRKVSVSKTTGEVKTDVVTTYNFNHEKYLRDVSLDGYYSIITNDLSLTPMEIISIYHGLFKIEESFKVTKTDLEGRPVYVWTDEHIKGHFLTCYLALVAIRLLQIKLGNKYSVSRILYDLKNASVLELEKGYYKIVEFGEVVSSLARIDDLNIKHQYLKYETLMAELKK